MRLPSLVAAVDRALRAAGMPPRGRHARGRPLRRGRLRGAHRRARLAAPPPGLPPRGRAPRPRPAAGLGRRRGLLRRAVRDARRARSGAGAADVRARAARERGGLEQAARRERYAFLRRVRDEEAAAAIAVAHTRDDQAETLLLRLLRGAGATGLAGMRPRSGRRRCGRSSPSRGTRSWPTCASAGLAWREDPSNADTAHRRNRVRHELLPYLEERFNPGIRAALARTAALLADEAAHVRAGGRGAPRRDRAARRAGRSSSGARPSPRRPRPSPAPRSGRPCPGRAASPRWARSTSSGSSSSPARRPPPGAGCPCPAGGRPASPGTRSGSKSVPVRPRKPYHPREEP